MAEAPELPGLDFSIKSEKYAMKIRLLDPSMIEIYEKNPNYYYTLIEKAMKSIFYPEGDKENSKGKYPP